MRGRLVSLVIPRFSLVSSLVSTQELLLSEPEAASVSTVPTGRVVSGFVPVDANCHGSVLVATPWRWPSPSRLPSRRRLPARSRCPLALPVQCPCAQAIPSGSAIHRPVQQRQDPPQTGFFPHGRADRRYGRSSRPKCTRMRCAPSSFRRGPICSSISLPNTISVVVCRLKFSIRRSYPSY